MLGSIFCKFLDIFGVMFWTSFWTTFGIVFGAILGLLLGSQEVKKWTFFWKGFCWPFGGTLGGFLAVLGGPLSLKNNTKQQFSKSLLFAIVAPWDGF